MIVRLSAYLIPCFLPTGIFDEDPAGRFGRRYEEMIPAVPTPAFGSHKTNISFVHQSGHLERLAGRLL
jgi:hypothetical protein